MTRYRLVDVGGKTYDDTTPQQLKRVLDATAVDGRLILDSPDLPDDHFAQVLREPGSAWRVEVSAEKGLWFCEVPNTDAAFDVLRSWVIGDDWWREAFSWSPA